MQICKKAIEKLIEKHIPKVIVLKGKTLITQ